MCFVGSVTTTGNRRNSWRGENNSVSSLKLNKHSDSLLNLTVPSALGSGYLLLLLVRFRALSVVCIRTLQFVFSLLCRCIRKFIRISCRVASSSSTPLYSIQFYSGRSLSQQHHTRCRVYSTSPTVPYYVLDYHCKTYNLSFCGFYLIRVNNWINTGSPSSSLRTLVSLSPAGLQTKDTTIIHGLLC